MTQEQEFDLVVIGGGPAGEKGAAQAAYFGRRVAVIEKAPEPGGAAVHTGTLPSKTLRETAIYLSGWRARDLYGISVKLDDPHAAVPRLIARKDAIAVAESARIRENLRRHGVSYFQGHARFVDSHVVEVQGPDPARLRGKFFLVATGSKPRRPPDVPIEEREVYDSDEILEIDRLPATMVVLGGGVIGCEYACMFAALGVQVTLVDTRTEILPFLDREIIERLRQAMGNLGIRLVLGQKWKRVHREKERRIACDLDGGECLISEALLFAAGRVGNTAELGLDRIGVTPDGRGYIPVDPTFFRTSAAHVYAAGDVIGFPALASASMEQARVAVCHAFGFAYKQGVSPILPYGIYTIPEVSSVGETEQTCQEKNIDYVVGRALFHENARGQITGDLEGITKLVVDARSRKLIGVHVIGERASELVHIGQLAMHLDASIDVFIEMVFNYPTLSESYKYAAYAALGALMKRQTIAP